MSNLLKYLGIRRLMAEWPEYHSCRQTVEIIVQNLHPSSLTFIGGSHGPAPLLFSSVLWLAFVCGTFTDGAQQMRAVCFQVEFAFHARPSPWAQLFQCRQNQFCGADRVKPTARHRSNCTHRLKRSLPGEHSPNRKPTASHRGRQ